MIIQEKIMIFGGTGSLGKKLIQRFAKNNKVIVYSRDEAKHWTIRNQHLNTDINDNLSFVVGDIRDKIRVLDTIRRYQPTKIIIAAALKQVDTCELSPDESVKTNLIGTQNIIDAINSIDGHRTVMFISTDKACSPVNVYGMCKSISERIVTSQSIRTSDNKYLCVRYGNVLESRGSIIPLFKYQAENNAYLTVTDPEMTRYVMTLDDSVDLIEHTFCNGVSGETWIPKLKSMLIGDLAKIFALKHNKQIKIIGLRPGEKKHEDLINESESVRTRDVGTHYVISPSYIAGSGKNFTYSSDQNVMCQEELEAHLTSLNIIEKPLNSFEGKSIEEIAI
jgi:UDP-glucose 4-epimerase